MHMSIWDFLIVECWPIVDIITTAIHATLLILNNYFLLMLPPPAHPISFPPTPISNFITVAICSAFGDPGDMTWYPTPG